MKIKIHRGIKQIGGCITEIATEKTKILIDLGQNLPDGDGVVIDTLAHNEAIRELTSGHAFPKCLAQVCNLVNPMTQVVKLTLYFCL